MKTFEKNLKDPNSTENKFFNSFIENINGFLNQKLSILIAKEYDNVIKVAESFELDSQETFTEK